MDRGQGMAEKIARALAASALLLTGVASARGVSPYLPTHLAPEIDRNIERVLILADRPILTRPIALASVQEALPKACEVDAELCEAVRAYLEVYERSFGITHASADGAVTRDDPKALANQHGLTAEDPWRVSAAASWRPSDYAMLSLGGVAYDGSAVATGSVLSMGFEYAQLDVGYRDHWFSPLTDSSMLISSQAATMPSVTLSNYKPLTSWGLRYQAFLAEMSESDQIVAEDGSLTAGNPRLFGLHVSIEPASGWSLGLSRLMQYGGGSRSSSFGDLLDAFFRPAEVDNSDSSDEFGNQVAAITSRFLFPGRTPFAVYFEYAGEDTSNSESFRLGNAALSAGIHFPTLWRRLDLQYEISEWQNAWYVSGIYLDGLTNDDHVIGHWAGDDRQFNDGVGGQSHMLRLGWESESGTLTELRYRTLANEDYSPVDYQRAHDVTFGFSRPWRPFFIGAELQFGRDVFGEDFGRLSGFVRYAPSAPRSASSRTASSTPGERLGEVFVDAGVNAGRVRQDILDSSDVTTTDLEVAPHFGLGVRRPVAANHDLGARLELDEFDGEPLLAVRALDYRYRFANSLALTGFLGAARYDLATPAYGYYFGVGAQWRNLADRWDLALDLRYGDKLARDRLLPGEPTGQRPDSFFDIVSATVYLSYRL
jgi:hypothetical protein